MPRKLPQKASARKTEDRSPHAIQIHRNNRNIDALHNAFHAAAERQHLPDARHLSFGEDANNLAVLQGLGRLPQGMDHLARPLIGRDGNYTQYFCKGFDQQVVVGALEHEEAHRPIERRDQESSIRHGDVIRDEQGAAFRGNAFAPGDIQAIERVRSKPEQQTQHGIRQQIQHIGRRGERGQRGPQKNRGCSKPKRMRQHVIHAGRSADPHERKQIRRGDHSALLAFVRPVLDQRVDRHDEEAACESQPRQQHQHIRKRQAPRGQQQSQAVMPSEPRGISPYSIFPEERNPAARLPNPIPMAMDACRIPLWVELIFRTSWP